MTKIRKTEIHFQQAFPANEELAPFALRAVALYLDLQTELTVLRLQNKLEHERLPGLTAFYFLRGNIRTLYGAHKLFDGLMAEPKWRENWLKAIKTEYQKLWAEKLRDARKHRAETDGDRNQLAAHLERDFGDMVHKLRNHSSYAEIEEDGEYWPLFAASIMMQALAPNGDFGSPAGQLAAIGPKLNRYADATMAVQGCLNLFLATYGQQYELGLRIPDPAGSKNERPTHPSKPTPKRKRKVARKRMG